MLGQSSWGTVRWLLAGIVVIVGVLAMPRFQYVGDPLAIRAAAVNWLNTGRIDVPEEVALVTGQRGQYYFQNPNNGRYYSKYGALNTVCYLPVLFLEKQLYGELPLYNIGPKRTLLLNVQNIVLSLVLALVLLELAHLYCGKPYLALLWVVASLYASFGWNYLRAQTAEIWQWVLASCFVLFVMRLCRASESRRWLILSQLSLILLILAKGVYALWGLVWIAILAGLAWRGSIDRRDWRWWLAALLPLAVGAAVVLGCNYFKFGDALASGYTQWERERHFFSGNAWTGLIGLLFSPDKSIFIYQPLLVFALFYWPAFWRRWGLESAAILAAFALLLGLISCTINWGGHWSYGPRYLLAILSPLTLPVLLIEENVCSKPFNWWKCSVMALISAVLLFSTWMQYQVNSLEFFTYYWVEGLVEACNSQEAMAELHRLPFGIVNYQLKRFAQTDCLPQFALTASKGLPSTAPAIVQSELLKLVNYNWYFWQ